MSVVATAGPYGKTTGTAAGPSGPSGQSTYVNEFVAWADSDYIYAIKLEWTGGSPASVLYGDKSHGTKAVKTLGTGEWVCAAYVDVDPQSFLRGLSFDSNINTGIYLGGEFGDTIYTAFSGSNDQWTDLIVYTGENGLGNTVIWGIEFYYNTPSFFPYPAELALPALGIMAHSMVVAKSLKKVGKLRGQLSIQAPSCDPPAGTDPAKAQLWYRTFRAQENCKEMFLVYFPSILVASALGYQVFGKWAARTVGILSLTGAFFRYKYLNAYIEDADKRGPAFRNAALSMKPVFYLAVVSCGYLVGKEVITSVRRRLSRQNRKVVE